MVKESGPDQPAVREIAVKPMLRYGFHRRRPWCHASLNRLVIVIFALLSAGCGGGGNSGGDSTAAVCQGFGPWQESAYVLPFPVGSGHILDQGNCSGYGHSGFWRFGYDFLMPIGTIVTAARDGIVRHANDGALDGDRTRTNLVAVLHVDGTVALYSHLTRGLAVAAGQTVRRGDVVGQSGDTGNTGGTPHLHFSLHPCDKLPGLVGGDQTSCPTIPVNFSNTMPNPFGPVVGRFWEALPYGD